MLPLPLPLLLLLLTPLAAAGGGQLLVTDRVFLEVTAGGEPLGRIVLGLFGQLAPRTVRNFLQLAGAGVGGRSYAGSRFHRVIRNFMVQGGDVLSGDGTGSISIYGESFEDEIRDEARHSAPGILSMANAGKDSNGCQFFITTAATPWLDGHHTVFGRVLEGMAVLRRLEREPTDGQDRPLRPLLVAAAGSLPTPQPLALSDATSDLWDWLRAIMLPLSMSLSILALFHWMIRRLDLVA